ncbi:hypothetical protein LN042_33535 [Kitasatospora sp. RB6PN24]|uniref:hypothetical protein n=1 Tax=Kitasatospora humi TaxID=2893891 RepID=UPI001E5EB552|nr:hypothetical protein [Kitasatospora humi]MCC9311929.1 hypothetical protein [Kitasatospora humi]
MTPPAWTDDELVAAIREFAEANGLPGPAPVAAADELEAFTGYPLPPLLRRLYCEGANGGFGTFGGRPRERHRVTGGAVSLTWAGTCFSGEVSLLSVYDGYTAQASGEPPNTYPRSMLPLVTTGGIVWWCVDLSTPEGTMFGHHWWACEQHWMVPQNLTLAEWLTDWLRGNEPIPAVSPVPGCCAPLTSETGRQPARLPTTAHRAWPRGSRGSILLGILRRIAGWVAGTP